MFVRLLFKMTLITIILIIQIIGVIFYYIFIQIMNQDIFNILVTVYIGISALIIPLGIFAMDKDNIDKRNIFKIALIKNSNIEKLIKKTVLVFLLILIQLLIPITGIVFIIRLLIYFLTVQLILIISKSFVNVINIITNEDEKQKYVNEVFVENIEKFNKEIKRNNNIGEKTKTSLKNFCTKENYISYDNDFMFDINDHYNSIYPEKEGRIKTINFESIKMLNKKIKNYVEKNISKVSNISNDNFCIFRKVEGEKINEWEPLIYIIKELEPLNINYKDFYNIEDLVETEKKVIENQIIDVCQIYVDNINKNNIYGIKKSKEEFIILYKTLIKNNAIYFLDILRENLQDFFSKFEYNSDISFKEICYKLYFLAVENDIYNDFRFYLNLFFSMRLYHLEEEVEFIFQNLFSIKNIISNNKNIKNKEQYIVFVTCLEQRLFKYLFNKQMYDIIIKHDIIERDLTIYNLNLHMDRILKYEEFPEKFIKFNLEIEKNKEYELYNNMLFSLTLNNVIWLNIAEWARCNYNKNKEIFEFITIILKKFKYLDMDDVIELYMEIRLDNRLDDVLSFWEWDFEGFDINKMIYLIFIKSNVSDKRKIRFKKYIKKENIYVFEEFKNNIRAIDIENIEILNITKIELENKKDASIKYIQELIEICEEERNKEIEKFRIDLEDEKRFKNSCIENLKEKRKNNNIFDFFNSIKRVEYSNEVGKKFVGCQMNAYKGDCLNGLEFEINNFSEELSEKLIEVQSNKILQSISKHCINTNESIEEIIEKFLNKNQVYILTPYITNDFNIYDDKSYCYTYKKNGENINIPVIEQMGFRNEIIIGHKESFGNIRFYKIKGRHNDNADEYTIASIKDLLGHREYINLNLYQDVRYIKSDNNSLYKKKIRD